MTPTDTARRLRELSTLVAVAEILNSAADLDTALRGALARVLEVLGLRTGWILLTRTEEVEGKPRQVFYPAAAQDLPAALARHDLAALRGQGCECENRFGGGSSARAVDVVECSRLRDAAGYVRGLKYHASVPLISRERFLGILNVAMESRDRLSAEDLQVLSAAGYQIGLAVERAQLYDLLQERRLEEQGALLKLSDALLRAADLQTILDQLVRITTDVLGADGSAVILATPQGQQPLPAQTGKPEGSNGTRLVGAAATIPGWGGMLSSDRGPAGWVVNHGEPLKVPDLAVDARWEHPLAAEEAGFKSAAMVPLIQGGRTLGALGAYCRETCRFDDDDMRLLALMGNQAALAIEQARLHSRELEEQRMRRELEVAREIQSSFLPDICPNLPGWTVCGYYQAAREVGGDFYDFLPLPSRDAAPGAPRGQAAAGSGRTGVVIADVADKGVPAALFMALSRTLVRATAMGGRPPAEAIERANTLILADTRTDMFVTLFYGIVDPATGEFAYVNAGHNPPLWYSARTGEVRRLPGRGIVLGVLPGVVPVEECVEIAMGDVVLLYTDGLTEALNAQGEEFGETRLMGILAASARGHADDVMRALTSAHEQFTGGLAPFDDVTMVVLKRTDPATR